jgi:uncharacterized phiE125 gp8 family phage protein
MVMTRIQVPAVEPVTLVEAKAHLRVTDSLEDTLIGRLIAAAREEVEAAAGLALISQNWRLYLDAWPSSGIVRIRRHPVQSIIMVTVYDRNGVAHAQSLSGLVLDRASRPARLHVPDSLMPPAHITNGIEIDFRAGYGDTGVDVPDGLKRAVLLLVAHWFEHRGSGETGSVATWPEGFDRIVQRYRQMEL